MANRQASRSTARRHTPAIAKPPFRRRKAPASSPEASARQRPLAGAAPSVSLEVIEAVVAQPALGEYGASSPGVPALTAARQKSGRAAACLTGRPPDKPG